MKHIAQLKKAFLMEQLGNNNRRSIQPLKKKAEKKEKSTQISLVMKYNQALENFRKSISNNWGLLKINNRLKYVFREKHVAAK